ncbi:gp8 [Synechococcus phage Syn5]|uniref:Gp8 n=1 Tax=Synechococcus phage Syn5 TaxID=2914003 RepID=A4ZR89_9CAUD|nr:gp8 [Synechococcus phage Syn5]ABP87915.1 gp8 [Synechococcus phage Syn5]
MTSPLALAQLIIPMTNKPEPKPESIYRKYWRTAK